jgi:ferritin-like metal-binding protein YciE
MVVEMRNRLSRLSAEPGNLSENERWLSGVAGLALGLIALRNRSAVGKLLLAAAAVPMLARSATGYCAMKSAIAGETSLRQGMQEQVRRIRQSLSATTGRIGSMDTLYRIELQELRDAEGRFAALIERTVPCLQDESVALRVDEYGAELHARRSDVEGVLARMEMDAQVHEDDAMRALIRETEKMARVCAPAVRDAALIASLQRIIHYKIAGYGTIAAYAKALGRTEDAARFAQLAARDKAVDEEFSRLAKGTLNPQAATAPEPTIAPRSVRTH